MCDMDGGECASVWVERTIKARKQHQCDACGGRIKAGETYTRHFSTFDGYVSSGNKCAACTEAMKEFAAEPGHLYVPPDSFDEVLQECIDAGDTEEESARWRKMRDEMRNRHRAAQQAGR